VIMKRLGIIGFGSIAQSLIDILRDNISEEYVRVCLLVREESVEEVYQQLKATKAGLTKTVLVHSDLNAFIADAPDLVVECASHSAVQNYVPALLEADIDVIIASIGALADEALYEAIKRAAEAGNAQITLPAGAIGGVDVMAAAKLSDIQEVIYTGRKPPKAWKGTRAEDAVSLDELTEESVFFEGTAREAAKAYPKNANVAATLALAGVGFEKTRVKLIADPATNKNTHSYSVVSDVVSYSVELMSVASPKNPKTSMTTVYSLAREVLNKDSNVAI
jgi:aspartate dehydrogenase